MAVNRVLLVFFASLACCCLAAEDGLLGRRAGDFSASPGGPAFGGEAPNYRGKTSDGSVIRMRGEGQTRTSLSDLPLRGEPLYLLSPGFLPPAAESPPPPPYPSPFPIVWPPPSPPPPSPSPPPPPPSPSPPPPSPPPPPPSPPPPPPSPSPPPPSPPPPPPSPPPPPPSPSPPPPSPPPPPPSPPPPPPFPSPPPPSPPPPPPSPPPPPEPRPHPYPPPPTPSPSPSPAPAASVLLNLSVSEGGKLVPTFNPLVFNYEARFGSNFTAFRVTAYVPEEEEDYRHVSLNIESIPLKSGEESPLLQLGKKGETVTYHISVKAVNHISSTYLLAATRGGGHKRSIGIIVLIVVAVIVAVLLCLLLGYAAYVYARTGRMLELRDFQIFRRRENLYSPLVSSRSS